MAQFNAAYQAVMTPVLAAMDRGDSAAARSELEGALRRLPITAPHPETRRALAISIYYQLFIISLVFEPQGDLEEAFNSALERVDVGAEHRDSLIIRNRFLLQLLCIGDRQGFSWLRPERLRELLAGIAEPFRDHELCHSLSHWAFKYGDREILELTLDNFMRSEQTRLGTFQQQRIRFLIAILDGSARREDAQQYVEQANHFGFLRDFRVSIWPRLLELGLAGPQLATLYDARIAELGISEGLPPLADDAELPADAL